MSMPYVLQVRGVVYVGATPLGLCAAKRIAMVREREEQFCTAVSKRSKANYN